MTQPLFIFNTPPHQHVHSQERLDLILAASEFFSDIKILFIDDGVYHLVPDQNAECIHKKQYTDTFKALELFGVEHIYMHTPSLAKRNIDELIIPAEPLTEKITGLAVINHNQPHSLADILTPQSTIIHIQDGVYQTPQAHIKTYALEQDVQARGLTHNTTINTQQFIELCQQYEILLQ